ncbi:patatin-like phospholipase family protein [Dyadobacter sp. NIV53]|uniref:patatin-like phospholipase family protein n=1 Tax=Dyadobacter sp. NIV53 TaxID=2861765 RepID=UPI001C881437|nr:patatin-like phospholipase family protein [Dyadobacter sp. NIV53]
MEKQKIHLVLNGGGMRCISYIGAIKELLDNQIEIVSISASSMGTIIGSMLASGLTIDEMERKVLNFNFRRFQKKRSFSKLRIFVYPFATHETPNYLEIVEELIGGDCELGTLELPLSINAFDMLSKKILTFSSNDPERKKILLSKALTISTSFPPRYEPVEFENSLFVDAVVAGSSAVLAASQQKGFYPILVLRPGLAAVNPRKINVLRYVRFLIESSVVVHDSYVNLQIGRSTEVTTYYGDINALDLNIGPDDIRLLFAEGRSSMKKKLQEIDSNFSYLIKGYGALEYNADVISEESHKSSSIGECMPSAIAELFRKNSIFVSYSHEDYVWLSSFQKHLSTAQRYHKLVVWTDQDIKPGDLWMQQIDNALDNARIVVFLVSPSFFNSNFIQDKELPYLLNKHIDGEVKIVWIALSFVLYEGTPIEKFQCANNPREPIDSLPDSERNLVWVNICKNILYEMENPDI